jgi:hypothetical protein
VAYFGGAVNFWHGLISLSLPLLLLICADIGQRIACPRGYASTGYLLGLLGGPLGLVACLLLPQADNPALKVEEELRLRRFDPGALRWWIGVFFAQAAAWHAALLSLHIPAWYDFSTWGGSIFSLERHWLLHLTILAALVMLAVNLLGRQAAAPAYMLRVASDHASQSQALGLWQTQRWRLALAARQLTLANVVGVISLGCACFPLLFVWIFFIPGDDTAAVRTGFFWGIVVLLSIYGLTLLLRRQAQSEVLDAGHHIAALLTSTLNSREERLPGMAQSHLYSLSKYFQSAYELDPLPDVFVREPWDDDDDDSYRSERAQPDDKHWTTFTPTGAYPSSRLPTDAQLPLEPQRTVAEYERETAVWHFNAESAAHELRSTRGLPEIADMLGLCEAMCFHEYLRLTGDERALSTGPSLGTRLVYRFIGGLVLLALPVLATIYVVGWYFRIKTVADTPFMQEQREALLMGAVNGPTLAIWFCLAVAGLTLSLGWLVRSFRQRS